MDNREKPLWVKMMVFVLTIGFCFCIYFGMRVFILRKALTRVEDSIKSYFYQFDLVTDDKNPKKIGFEGVYFKLNQDTPWLNDKSEASILLIDMENSKNVYTFSIAQRTERPDIEEYFKCDYSYLYSGIVTEKREVELKEKTYEVLFKENKYGRSAVETGLYIHNGQLVRYNPNSFQKPEVTGTDLEKIVNDGYLMAYRPEFDIWVYQYEWNLYWIAGEDYFFEEDDSTYIQFQMETTQIERLPEERIANGWYWSNIGDYFEKHELTNIIDTGHYRVSMREIPTDYSITIIWTGYHNEDHWIWQNSFRPILK